MKKIVIIIMISIWIAMFWSVLQANTTITSKCEAALKNSVQVAWKFTETNSGYKAMIIADNNATKICNNKT